MGGGPHAAGAPGVEQRRREDAILRTEPVSDRHGNSRLRSTQKGVVFRAVGHQEQQTSRSHQEAWPGFHLPHVLGL